MTEPWHPEHNPASSRALREMALRGRSEDGRWPHEPPAPDDDPSAGDREPRQPIPEPLTGARALDLPTDDPPGTTG